MSGNLFIFFLFLFLQREGLISFFVRNFHLHICMPWASEKWVQDGPSAQKLAKELAKLKEKEKELSASLKIMEENLLVARKEKEDIVQFGMLFLCFFFFFLFVFSFFCPSCPVNFPFFSVSYVHATLFPLGCPPALLPLCR